MATMTPEQIIEKINEWITNNGVHSITGGHTNTILNAIMEYVGVGFAFMGEATAAAPSPDVPVVYLAGPGSYTGYDDEDVVIPDGSLGVFSFDGSAWSPDVIKVVDPVSVSQNTEIGGIEVTIGARTINVPYDTGIYKAVPDDCKPVAQFYDLSIEHAVNGKLYFIECNNLLGDRQQLTLFRTSSENPTSYDEFVHFVYKVSTDTYDTGICKYVVELESGEIISLIINWDMVPEIEATYYPNEYILSDKCFYGGLFNRTFAKILEDNIEPDSVTLDKVNSIVRNFLLSMSADVNVSNSIISPTDLFSPGDVWQEGGTIDEIGNDGLKSKIQFTAEGASAPWQSYITAFITKEELEKRGFDFSKPVYIDTHFGSRVVNVWFVLRYDNDDTKSFYPTGDVDAVINLDGTTQGLADGDLSTWAEFTSEVRSDGADFRKLLIPTTYQNKNFYALLICFGNGDGMQTFENFGVHYNVFDGQLLNNLFKSVPDMNEMIDVEKRVTALEKNAPTEDIYYAACGDSITNANHDSIMDIAEGDPYMPIDGYEQVSTYKRKNYAYYLSKRYGLTWANYGWGGTCLHDCKPKAFIDSVMELSHPFVGSRIENLKAGVNWNYISIFFGWNDHYYGPIYQRDLWLQETYGEDIGYPVENEQIGAPGFATQAQKDACDAATGSVGGVQYNDTYEYFFARFIGTIDDSVKTTWMGAWNYALDYLMRKYPTAKIMIVAPFVADFSDMVRQAVKDIAEKWGVVCFDFEDLPYWYYKAAPNYTPFAPASGQWTTENGVACGNTVEGYNQARLSYDTLHPSNLGYQTIAGPIGDKLING